MSIIIPANTLAAGGFDVANSVNCGDTSTRWSGSSKVTSTSQQKGSWNIWLKRTVLGAQGLFKVYDSGNTGTEFGFDSSDQFFMKEFESGSDVFNLKTNAKFRDPSAWMNILLAIDTTQGTEANRIRLYINGVEPSLATSTRPSVNTNLVRFFANGEDDSTQVHEMGNNYDGATGHYLLTQILYVDGTQLANTDVGEFDEDSNIWKPIDISGTTLGNNGYYLSMEDSSNFGVATGKAMTAHGFAATDSRIDTCTNNFATLNPLFKQDGVFSEGNLVYTIAASDFDSGVSTFGAANGKWYFETKITAIASGTTRNSVGICDARDGNYVAENEFGQPGSAIVGDTVGYTGNSSTAVFKNNSSVYSGTTYTTNDILCCAVDLDNGAVYYRKNGGSFLNSGDPTSGSSRTGAVTITTGETYLFGNTAYAGSAFAINFGSPPYSESGGETDGDGFGNFNQAVPSGYFALCTKNLAEYG